MKGQGIFRHGIPTNDWPGLRPTAALRLVLPALISAGLLLFASSAVALAPGDPDPTFGSGGVAYYPLGSSSDRSQINSVALQPDGKIVLAGQVSDVVNSVNETLVMRLNPDGSPDASFGVGGKILKQYGSGTSASSSANSVAVQPDGKIVVGLEAYSGSAFNGLVALRLEPNGEPDPSFGDGGKVFAKPVFPLPAQPADSDFDEPRVLSIALQPDGKILLGGESLLYHASYLFVDRLNGADGSFDSTFGDGGRVLINLLQSPNIRHYVQASALALQPGGDILVTGTDNLEGLSDVVVTRLSGANGAPDPAFGAKNALQYSPYGDCAAGGAGNAVAPLPGGKFLVAGQVFGPDDCEATQPVQHSPGLLAQFAGAGLDPTFGNGGTVFTEALPGAPRSADFYGLAVRPDGKFVLAGIADVNSPQALVARFQGDDLDPTFGNGGVVTRQLDTGADPKTELHAMALQPDAKIVAAGFAGSQAVVMRLIGDTPPSDGSSGGGGGGGGNQLGPQNLVATISRLGITPAVFAAAPSGPSIAKTIGAQVSYENTQAATTMLTVLKPARGVRYKGSCAKPSRHRHGKRCTRWVAVGRFTHADKVGLNSFRFTGRVYGHKLRPGRYKLRARPRFAGPAGQAIEVSFRIVR
jgi:uncharacterized delta-60 repeat protein